MSDESNTIINIASGSPDLNAKSIGSERSSYGTPEPQNELHVESRNNRLLSPLWKNDDAASSVGTSQDSFAWLEEDEEQMAIADEYVLGESEAIINLDHRLTFSDFLPSKVFDYGAFLIFSGLLLASLAGLAVPLPEIIQVGLHVWTLIAWMVIFLPFFIGYAFKFTVKRLKHHRILGQSALPSYLEAIEAPLTLLSVLLTVSVVWFLQVPLTCDDLHTFEDAAPVNPLELCYLSYAPKVFACLLLYSLMQIMHSLLMRHVRKSFHEKTFRARLIESRFKCYVVDQLKAAADAKEKSKKEKRKREKSPSMRSVYTIPDSMPEESTMLLPFKIPTPISRFFTSNDDEGFEPIPEARTSSHRPARDYSGFKKRVIENMRLTGFESASTTPPRTDMEARILAREIFRHLCPPTRDFLIMDDFTSIFETPSASRDAYYTFDRDQDGRVSKKEFRSAMVHTFRGERNLRQSIADAGQALSKLDEILWGIFCSVLVLTCLSIFDFAVQSLLTFSLSVIIGLNFVIGETAKNTFVSLIFIFVNHPYDVGDKVVIAFADSCSADLFTVIQINLLSTVFRRWNGHEIYVCNSYLATTPIVNTSRTTEQWERIDFEISARSAEGDDGDRLARFRDELEQFLRLHGGDYHVYFDLRAVVAADSGFNEASLDTLAFTLRVQCKQTVDVQKKWQRHARLLAFVKTTVKDLGMQFVKHVSE